MDLTSWTDTILHSDRETQNTVRLASITDRPIWTHMFNEFPDTKFVLYHSHDNIKIPISDNVEIVVKTSKSEQASEIPIPITKPIENNIVINIGFCLKCL